MSAPQPVNKRQRKGRNPPEVIVLDEYRPSYARECVACGQRPVVEGFKANRRVYEGDLCGPCTFGTAQALDPKQWNALD